MDKNSKSENMHASYYNSIMNIRINVCQKDQKKKKTFH